MRRFTISCIFYLILSGTLHAQTFGWARAFGGSDWDKGTSLCIDAGGNTYATGYFTGTVDFDPGPGVSNHTSVGAYGSPFIVKLDTAGNYVWVLPIEVAGGSSAITFDPSGNIYVTGYFSGTGDFDPGPGTANLTAPTPSGTFVLKMSAAGNYIWAKGFGGNSTGIIVDASGNVCTTGFFQSIADFDPGAGTVNLTPAGMSDGYIQKMDASGHFIWANSIGGPGDDAILGIAVNAAGDIYTAGNFQGTVDFDPGSGTDNYTSAGGYDGFIHKLGASGNFAWAITYGSVNYDAVAAIASDAAGNIHVSGIYSGTVDFDPGSGTDYHTAADMDAFVIKLNPYGNLLWAKTFGGSPGASSSTGSNTLTLDGANNVYSSGSISGNTSFDLDPGPGTDMHTEGTYVQKLDTSGNFVWAVVYGGSSSTGGAEPAKIAVNNSGSTITTVGSFGGGPVDFDPGSGITAFTASGPYDIYLQRLKQNGTTTNLYNQKNNLMVTVFPNPVEGTVYITSGKVLQQVELVITDITGKTVAQEITDISRNKKIQLPATAGIYFLTIKTSEGQQTMKLIKE